MSPSASGDTLDRETTTKLLDQGWPYKDDADAASKIPGVEAWAETIGDLAEQVRDMREMPETVAARTEDADAKAKWRFSADTASAEVRAAAAQMVAESRIPGASLGTLLNVYLSKHLPWPYCAGSGTAFDSAGAESSKFGSLIYTSPDVVGRVPADKLACVIDIHESLSLEQLRRAYEKIAHAKMLGKAAIPTVPQGVPVADATMGIIFARDSEIPIEALAEEVARLNRQHSYRFWPDMVVVLSRGTVNLACQFPYMPLGDFLPPARGVTYRAAMYVHVFARAHREFTLNKMCALLFSYLYMFQPGVGLPPYQEILKDMPKIGIPVAGFQFNLKGDLVPVPTEMRFIECFLFPLSFRVEDQQGSLHAKVQYMPWQDGGVVRVQGQFPIEALLVFAGKEALSEPILRYQGEQTSGVIPMSREQFKEMATRIADRSNLVIKPDQRPNLVIHKRGDEGTSSPFIARVFLGICMLRDQAIADKSLRNEFDKSFEGVLTGLESLRDTAKSINKLYSSHSGAVARGHGSRIVNRDIYVDEPIDLELKKQIESLISTASRIVKERMKGSMKMLDANIGFLFQKESAFKNGVARLRANDPALANYLIETRAKWCERLLKIRNDLLEHGTWSLEPVRYEVFGTNVRAIEPLVDGQPVTDFVSHIVDRICCFVEELCAHALQARMLHDVSITEIPLSERMPENVARFRVALVGGGTPLWTITYHDTKFEDT